jgi:hypothetical protein
MVQIGNHLKMNVAHSLRARTREFYAGLLQCKPLASPRVLGLFFVDAAQALSGADCLKATWLELKVADPIAWKARLTAFGVGEVEFSDPTRFFFQAPGGQVFRLAPRDGGL